MKLNAQEIQNYLARFYDALRAVSGTPIGDNGYCMHFPETARSPAIVHHGKETPPVFVAPAWDELTNPYAEAMRFNDSGAITFGITNIVMQHGDDYGCPVRIPFHMAFDMKKDVAHFIERLNTISDISFKEASGPALYVCADEGQYSSDLQK